MLEFEKDLGSYFLSNMFELKSDWKRSEICCSRTASPRPRGSKERMGGRRREEGGGKRMGGERKNKE